MIQFFKNRRIAILITVVVVIAAVLLGVYLSLSRLSKDIERMFYDGVYLKSAGYTQPGIDEQLGKYCDATNGLVTILKKYTELTDSCESVQSLRRELLEAERISDKSLAFAMLSRAVYSLLQTASDIDLISEDTGKISDYSKTISGAETSIRTSVYNQENFLRWDAQSSITRFLRLFISVREPDSF